MFTVGAVNSVELSCFLRCGVPAECRGQEYVVHAEDALILMYRDLPRHDDEAARASWVGCMFTNTFLNVETEPGGLHRSA